MGARHLDGYTTHYGHIFEVRACMDCNPDARDDRTVAVPCTGCDGSGWTEWAALADTPWTEITPNLWVGGCEYASVGDSGLREWHKAVVTDSDGFDTVITLWDGWNESYGPNGWSSIEHFTFPFPDGPLTHEVVDTVAEAAYQGMLAISRGDRLLVRCQAGLNRSALVAGVIMTSFGVTGEQAVSRIRHARSPWVLCNPDFEAYLSAL